VTRFGGSVIWIITLQNAGAHLPFSRVRGGGWMGGRQKIFSLFCSSGRAGTQQTQDCLSTMARTWSLAASASVLAPPHSSSYETGWHKQVYAVTKQFEVTFSSVFGSCDYFHLLMMIQLTTFLDHIWLTVFLRFSHPKPWTKMKDHEQIPKMFFPRNGQTCSLYNLKKERRHFILGKGTPDLGCQIPPCQGVAPSLRTACSQTAVPSCSPTNWARTLTQLSGLC
jgi:hypothetical protein